MCTMHICIYVCNNREKEVMNLKERKWENRRKEDRKGKCYNYNFKSKNYHIKNVTMKPHHLSYLGKMYSRKLPKSTVLRHKFCNYLKKSLSSFTFFPAGRSPRRSDGNSNRLAILLRKKTLFLIFN